MFREGQYLEVIKTPDGCMATAIVTIKEKTVEYKNKAIKTNKWLDLQDWVSLYGIIRKAIIRNNESRSNGKSEGTERRKSTRNLEVTYKFEDAESPEDRTSLPTIRLTVKPLRKSVFSHGDSKPSSNKNDATEGEAAAAPMTVEKCSESRNDPSGKRAKKRRRTSEKSFLSENYSLEEYVPPKLPSSSAKPSPGLKYVPSRKSMLLRMRSSTDENKYTPTMGKNQSPEAAAKAAENNSHTEVSYIPNSIKSLTKLVHETYDPCCATVLPPDLSEAYVPSSKGARTAIEEYEPDFASKAMKFDDSYVPSSTTTSYKAAKAETRKRSRKSLDAARNKKSSTRAASEISKREL